MKQIATCIVVSLALWILATPSVHATMMPREFIPWAKRHASMVSPANTASQPWVRWSRNPLTIPVTVLVTNVLADTNASVSVTLAEAGVEIPGLGDEHPTNSTFLADLKVRREYVLTVEADDLTSLDLQLAYQANWTPLTRRGRAAQPKSYLLLTNRLASPGRELVFNNGGGPCSNSWTIELTEHLPVNWRLEDGSNDPGSAPGDATWAELGPGKSLEKNHAAISWSVSLGRLMDGSAAGRLTIREPNLSWDIYTPTNIYYTVGSEVFRDEVELVSKELFSPVLRQIKTCQTFVDIVPLTTNETEMRFYSPSQIGTETDEHGHYTNISGSPFVIWALVNPDPDTTNALHIVEQRNGLTSTNEFVCDPTSSTNTWTLTYGQGDERRLETRGVVIDTASGTNRIETVDIRYEDDCSPAYRATETYHLYPWGFELVDTTIDPDNNSGTSNDLATTITFNTDSGEEESYGKPDTFTYPDGFWEKRLYYDSEEAFTGALGYVLSPDLDSPSTAASATFANSIVRKFSYDYYAGTCSGVTQYYKDDGTDNAQRMAIELRYRSTGDGNDIDSSYEGQTIPEEPTHSGTFDGPTEDGKVTVGSYGYTPDEWWGFGYFGHDLERNTSDGPTQLSYYHGGTYTNEAFTVNGVYSGAGLGPDWRKCTLFTGVADIDQTGGVTVFLAEGEPLYQGAQSGATLYPNRTWRESEIYQDGSLVQREKHVFTGVDGAEPQCSLVGKWVYLNDSLGHATNVTWVDGATGNPRVIYTADYQGTNSVAGDLLLWEADEQGITTAYSYDSLKRLISSEKQGTAAGGGFPEQPAITTSTGYDAVGRVLGETNSSGGLSYAWATTYDLAGRVVSQTDTNALTTTFLYELGGRKITRTLPDASTEIRENYFDRRLKSVTGTGVVHEYHDRDFVDTDTRSTESLMHRVVSMHTIHYGTEESDRWAQEGIDWVGRVIRREQPDYLSTNSVVDYLGYFSYQLGKQNSQYHSVRGEDLPMSITYFDFDGTSAYDCVPIDTHLWTEVASNHRMTHGTWSYYQDSGTGHWFKCATNVTYRVKDTGTPTLVSATRERLNGFSSTNILSEVTTWDADTNSTVATVTVDRDHKKVTEVLQVPYSSLAATNVTVNALLQASSSPTVAQPTRYGYDALGRRTGVTNSLLFASTTAYNSNNHVSCVTDFTGLQKSYEYYADGVMGAGKVACETLGGTHKTYYAYTNVAGLYRTWGDVPYPEERLYTSYGELTELHTYRDGVAWNQSSWPTSPGTADTTTWTYQEHSGLLASKTDALSRSISFTYTNGVLQTRTLARGPVATASYNNLGEVIGMDYSDSTPSFALVNETYTNFNRGGLPQVVSDRTGVWALEYDHAWRLTNSVCSSSTMGFGDVLLSSHYDPVHGRDRIEVSEVSPSLQTTFGFDAYGRLGSVTNGTTTATYGFIPDSDLIETTTFANSGTAKLTASRVWDYGSRLRSIGNTAGSALVTAHSYVYDGLNRRTRANLEDGSAWAYDYNDRNELISARRVWADQSPVDGQRFGYGYDNIGSRDFAQHGDDLRTIEYDANCLNQYTNIVTPGYLDVVGAALATDSVTVNSSATDRKGEYFHREITVDNSEDPVWQSVSVASDGGSDSGNVLFPPEEQDSISYDEDGNLTADGLWTYTWDAENRLTKVESVAAVPTAGKRKVDFTYDYSGRRATKKIYTHNGSSYQLTENLLFVYDGWSPLAALNATNCAVVQSYVWGSDLAGALPGDEEGAGGIGGLVVLSDSSLGSITSHFPAYDGNGNVTALVNVSDQSTSARYEYSPFGELIRATGPLAQTNPFRWSTKFWDDETGLSYYGRRFYSPALGRWINRDPIAEEGGLALYGFVANDPLSSFDALGMKKGGKQNVKVTGWENASVQDLENEIKRLKALNDPKLRNHIRALEGYTKTRSSTPKYSNKFGRSKGKSKGSGGYITGGGLAIGVAGGVTALGYAFTKLSTTSAVLDMRDAIAEGMVFSDQSSSEAHLYDFVRHLDSGDATMAEIDALIYAALQGGSAAGALAVWDALTDEIGDGE